MLIAYSWTTQLNLRGIVNANAEPREMKVARSACLGYRVEASRA
jgi:hypothetical protein